jgi:hypothetical protein
MGWNEVVMRKLAHVMWWLGLSAYFGGMLALGAIAAPSIFHTVRQTGATLPATPSWLKASDQLGGEIFGNILLNFAVLEWVAIACMFIGLAGRLDRKRWSSIVLVCLLLLLVWLKLDEQFSFYPLVWKLRAQMRAATMPDVDLAKTFQGLHELATIKGQVKLFCLLTLVVLSAWRRDEPLKSSDPQ